jgi:ubiquinone/menaquinone biosynthesis C-methylase UbiE
MSFYSDQILPRCIDFALSRPAVMEMRSRVVQGLHGRVLEIGFGTGLNLAYYPREVTQIYALDPLRTAPKLSAARIAACPVPIQWLALPSSGRLPLPDASVDSVLSTFTLCTIADLPTAFAELQRVLVPGGKLHFLEHGRSPERTIARLQDLLTPLNRRFAGGCHLNRSIDVLLRDAGFCLDKLTNEAMPGPRLTAYTFEGVARVCRDARHSGP